MSTLVDEVREALRRTAGLPLPGSGDTRRRWETLTELSRRDVVLGRLVEAHHDAVAILAELGEPAPEQEQWWGVWAAEPPSPTVTARIEGHRLSLDGAKPWCSGAGMCTHALMTVREEFSGQRLLASVPLQQPGVTVDDQVWHTAGMARSATTTVRFTNTEAHLVGSAQAYLERPGFWHGGAGVAACWFGGAELVAEALYARGSAAGQEDPHTAAHRGAVDAALAAARWSLAQAAEELDSSPMDARAARVRALRVRSIVEGAATEVLHRVGRALGPGPLCHDAEHSTAVADLEVYLRQSHAERDLAGLGELVR